MAKTKPTKNNPPKKTKPKTKSKRKSSKKKSKKSFKFYINIIILFLIVSFIIFLLNTLFFTNEIKESSKVQKKQAIEKLKKTLINNKENYEELTDELKIKYVEMPTVNNTVISKKDDARDEEFVFNDYKKELEDVKVNKFKKINNKKIIKKEIKTIINKESKKLIKKHSKPILAILIDDVTRQRQVNKILALPYDITMSFLPPTPTHKKSAIIAQNIKVAMIHLPTEASNRRHEEIDTLHIEDSFAKIDKKIASLRKLYPHIKYINNHTGSKFTQNNQAMNRLVKSLKKHGYYFVDSRTTAKTVIKKYAKKYHLKYLSRNVFLDNTQEKQYIQHQLKQAVKIAKKKGSAIAIGHPYNITIKTIAQSKDILKDVQIVYINELKI